MKIKALFVAIAVLLCGSAFAQESNRDANGNIQYGPYQTNKFFDNWFISVGGGVNCGIDGVVTAIKAKDLKKINYGFGIEAEANIGKWITPNYGVRFGWQGLNTAVDKKFHSKISEGKQINYVHADGLWNISNQFGGYKETRAINIVPYLHMGAMIEKGGKDFYGSVDKSGFAAGLGIMFPIRLGGVVSIVPDIRTTFARDGHISCVGSGLAANTSATLGLNFNLGKNNWTRLSTTLASSAAALAAAEAAKNALQAEKDRLANALNAANADKDALNKEIARLKGLKPEVIREGGLDLNKAMAVYFEKGKATLSAKELEHLEFYTKNVIANNDKIKFTVIGSADSKTGTKAGNAKLSQRRAEYIYNLLTGKYGISADNFTVKSLGGVANNANPELDRAVVIEKD